jgi:trimeric autotransporter adhesin
MDIMVAPGHTLNLQDLSFYVRRSGTGIRNYCVRSDADSFSNNLAAATGTNAKLEVLPGEVFLWKYDSISVTSDQRGSHVLFGSSFNVTNSITFRFYAWNSEASGGSFSIDNVTFTGSVVDSLILSGVSKETVLAEDAIRIMNTTEGLSLKVLHNITNAWICDLSGKIIWSNEQLEHGTSHTVIAPAGIYFLNHIDQQGVSRKKILKN